MKVGILTYHRSVNFGAYLQACALCSRLNQEDWIEAELIDYRMLREVKKYDVRTFPLKRKLAWIKNGNYFFEKKRMQAFESAWKNPVMKRSSDSLTSDSLEEFSAFVRGKYDVIVAGSDEIWKVNNFRGFPSAYWLPGDLGCRKMSYAASARVVFSEVLSPSEQELLRSFVQDFDYLGVRDQMTLDEIRKAAASGQKAGICCDPSFLSDFDLTGVSIDGILKKCCRSSKGRKTIMVMVDDKKTAEKIRRDLGGKYNLISVFHKHKGYINIPGIEPLQWLKLIETVDFVISSFFHAICFSIIKNKPFLAVGTRAGKQGKLTDLLSTDDLKARYIPAQNPGTDFDSLVKEKMVPVDFKTFVSQKRDSFGTFLDAMRSLEQQLPDREGSPEKRK